MIRTGQGRLTVTGSVLTAGLLALVGTACSGVSERLNSPPQGSTERRHPMQENYVAMNDNALLEEMSMSSAHFISHTPELNSNGARRLQRYAELLQIYGGTLAYDGGQDEETLTSGRIERIRNYLLAEGVPAEKFQVTQGLSGNAGMSAEESVEIRKQTRFQPGDEGEKSKTGGDSAMGGAGGMGGAKK